MNELQNKYIRNQILSVPMKLNQELTHKDKKFNKRSDYDNIIKYIDNFLEGDNINRFLVLPGGYVMLEKQLCYFRYMNIF